MISGNSLITRLITQQMQLLSVEQQERHQHLHEEHVETIRFAADYVKEVPVGTGSNCTETAVWLSKAQKAGVDGCLVVTPYYNKATQKGLVQLYSSCEVSRPSYHYV